MKREVYSRRIIKTALNITQNRIDSVRKNDIVRSACRVYDKGCIGISGFFGEPNEEHWKAAEENLSLCIPYEYEPEAGKQRSEDRRKEVLTQQEFLEKAEDMMARLHEQNPNFIFSNKIISMDLTESLKNDQGLDYQFRDRCYVFSIIFKHLDSNAVFDGGLGYQGRTFDAERFLADAHTILTAYQTPVQLPQEETIPVALGFGEVGGKILEGLSAEDLGKGTSIFAGKLGEKLFSEDFTLYADRTAENIATAFFDMEGSTVENDRIALIDRGTLVRGFCDKKNAAEFGCDNTACGEGGYDDVPSLGLAGIEVQPSEKSFADLLGKGRAILIDTMGGGDCTAEGNFASPVQLAYLIEDGRLVGRLPEFGLSGSIYKMFGEDYIGLSSDRPFFNDRLLLVRMKLN